VRKTKESFIEKHLGQEESQSVKLLDMKFQFFVRRRRRLLHTALLERELIIQEEFKEEERKKLEAKRSMVGASTGFAT